MATIKLDPRYEKVSDEFVAAFRARGILLSDYAEGLLRLSAESWFEEAPEFRPSAPFPRARLHQLAEEILRQAFEEEHLVQRVKQKRAVPFHELMYALGVSGRKVLREFLNKGF